MIFDTIDNANNAEDVIKIQLQMQKWIDILNAITGEETSVAFFALQLIKICAYSATVLKGTITNKPEEKTGIKDVATNNSKSWYNYWLTTLNIYWLHHDKQSKRNEQLTDQGCYNYNYRCWRRCAQHYSFSNCVEAVTNCSSVKEQMTKLLNYFN
jgi:hypothetical protein